MNLDHTVYPDIPNPPTVLETFEDKADYLHRICGAFDFGVFPERDDWELFSGWKDVFDRFQLCHSAGYHAFRAYYGWEPVPRESSSQLPSWKASDLAEGRIDPCEEWV